MKVPMKKLILFLLIVSILTCHGCIYPNPIYSGSVRTGFIDTSFITVGVTTKEQVVLRCGYPFSAVSDDERVFTYSWAIYEYNNYGDLQVGDRVKSYTTYLKIHFDENDIVKNFTLDEKKKE